MPVANPPTPPRVAVWNVGCKLNLCEVEALKSGFDQRGFQIVPFEAEADVYVVNTCTVTGSGDADSRKAVRRARRANPQATVVATGCYAQRRPEELRVAGAHLVLGNAQKSALFDHLQAHLRGEAVHEFDPDEPPRITRFLQIHGAVEQGRTRGSLQIQDGCDEHCTYCVIPQVRGPGVSRPVAEILEQARRMADAGYREVALTGVHSGRYGYDVGRTDALPSLLSGLEQIEGLARIRLNSIEPGYLTDALIEHVAGSAKVCRHFHVPLQSGDDRVLRRMGRRYTRAEYASRIERIARLVPHCAIGADAMVGFPGEEEEHFTSTFDLVQSLPLTYLHVFSYSPRGNTPAARLPAQTSGSVKAERARRLIRLSEEKRLAFHRRFLGDVLEVLVEDRRDPATDLPAGLSDNYVKVLCGGGEALVNRFARVRIARAREDVAFGEVERP